MKTFELPITIETLADFFATCNRHDTDEIMEFMSPDCVFFTAAGSEIYGARLAGKESVREAFVSIWANTPDARWINEKHVVQGDFGVSEWTFVGTLADGSKIEVNGVDIFTFKDGKIAIKNGFRKHRSNQQLIN
jgi:ketosteroid isomerase-like protein